MATKISTFNLLPREEETIFFSNIKDCDFENMGMTFGNRVLLEHLGQRAVSRVKAFRTFNMLALILFTSGQEAKLKP